MLDDSPKSIVDTIKKFNKDFEDISVNLELNTMQIEDFYFED